MNEKEIGEIRRHIRRERCNMTAIYGLNQDDSAKAVMVASMLLGRVNANEWAEKHEKLVKYVQAIHLSSKTGERVVVGEAE